MSDNDSKPKGQEQLREHKDTQLLRAIIDHKGLPEGKDGWADVASRLPDETNGEAVRARWNRMKKRMDLANLLGAESENEDPSKKTGKKAGKDDTKEESKTDKKGSKKSVKEDVKTTKKATPNGNSAAVKKSAKSTKAAKAKSKDGVNSNSDDEDDSVSDSTGFSKPSTPKSKKSQMPALDYTPPPDKQARRIRTRGVTAKLARLAAPVDDEDEDDEEEDEEEPVAVTRKSKAANGKTGDGKKKNAAS